MGTLADQLPEGQKEFRPDNTWELEFLMKVAMEQSKVVLWQPDTGVFTLVEEEER